VPALHLPVIQNGRDREYRESDRDCSSCDGGAEHPSPPLPRPGLADQGLELVG
jgi:hypothetical protein